MALPLTIIIVEKTGTLKSTLIKNYNESELYKKCGFKKSNGFVKQTEWNTVIDKNKMYSISVFAKEEGRANYENKYEFPPPIDTKLFFGNCAIVASIISKPNKNNENEVILTNLSLNLWDKIHKKLFGGFEDLKLSSFQHNNEPNELKNIPAYKKTQGYLKDGFVVNDKNKNSENSETSENDEDSEDDDEDSDESSNDNCNENNDTSQEYNAIKTLIGLELTEESYNYCTDEV
jgi:hypothetical protein